MVRKIGGLLIIVIFINLVIHCSYIASENKNYFVEKEEPEYEWNSIKVKI